MKINNKLVITVMSTMLGLSLMGATIKPLSVWAENNGVVFVVDTEAQADEQKSENLTAPKEETPANTTENKEDNKDNKEEIKEEAETKTDNKEEKSVSVEDKTEDMGLLTADDLFNMLVKGEEFKAYFESEDDAKTAAEIYGLTFVKYYPETKKATYTKVMSGSEELLRIIDAFKDKGLYTHLQGEVKDTTEENNPIETTTSKLEEVVQGEEFKAYFDTEEDAINASESYGLTFVRFYEKTGKASYTKEALTEEDLNGIIDAHKNDEHPLDYNTSNEDDLYDATWYEDKIRELEEQNTKLETKVVDLEGFVDTLRAKNAENEKSKNSLDSQLAQLTSQIAVLKNRSNKDVQDAMSELEKILKERQDARNKELEASIKNIKSSNTGSQISSSDLSNINSKLNSLSATTSSLSSKINSTTSDINTLKSDISDLKEDKTESASLNTSDYDEPDEEENLTLENNEPQETSVTLDQPVADTVKSEDIITYPNAYDNGGAGNINVNNPEQMSNPDNEHTRIDDQDTALDDGKKTNYTGLIGGFVALLCLVGLGGYFANKKFHFLGGNSYSEDISDDEYFSEDYEDTNNTYDEENYETQAQESADESESSDEAETVVYEDESNMVMEKIA